MPERELQESFQIFRSWSKEKPVARCNRLNPAMFSSIALRPGTNSYDLRFQGKDNQTKVSEPSSEEHCRIWREKTYLRFARCARWFCWTLLAWTERNSGVQTINEMYIPSLPFYHPYSTRQRCDNKSWPMAKTHVLFLEIGNRTWNKTRSHSIATIAISLKTCELARDRLDFPHEGGMKSMSLERIIRME
jgi:hypothetical protein